MEIILAGHAGEGQPSVFIGYWKPGTLEIDIEKVKREHPNVTSLYLQVRDSNNALFDIAEIINFGTK